VKVRTQEGFNLFILKKVDPCSLARERLGMISYLGYSLGSPPSKYLPLWAISSLLLLRKHLVMNLVFDNLPIGFFFFKW
jgi:hypothetical protein